MFFRRRHNDKQAPKTRRSPKKTTHRTLQFERLDDRMMLSASALLAADAVPDRSGPGKPDWIEVQSVQFGVAANAAKGATHMATGNAQRPLGVSDPVPAQSGQALSQPVAISNADFFAYGTLKYGANVNGASVASGSTGGASAVTAASKLAQVGQTSDGATTTTENTYDNGDQESDGGDKIEDDGPAPDKQPEPPADTQPEPPADTQPEPPAPDTQPEPPADTQPEPPADTQPEPPAPDTQPEQPPTDPKPEQPPADPKPETPPADPKPETPAAAKKPEDDGSKYGMNKNREDYIDDLLHDLDDARKSGDQGKFDRTFEELDAIVRHKK
jgi:hypothetical protein